MVCPKCSTENAASAKFCAECGAKLDPRCPSCGAQNPPDAKFCTQCGTRLGAASSQPASQPRASEPDAHSGPTLSERPTTDAAALPEGERKTVTALFADIKGSMDLMEDIDPEQARALIDPALRIMIDAVHRYDGYIVQSTGDGIFALFGAPIAHEDHPHRALLAALKMQDDMRRYSARLRESGDSPIEVRIGVNTGEAVVRSIRTDELHTEYTPIGHATSLAARMQALAPTGSIAITENTRRIVEGYFELKPLGPTRVKGLSELINVYQVVGLGPLRTRLQASARRGLSKFVGRDTEMVQLDRALELVRTGHGQIVAAVGEAGVGKSRLFHEFKIISHSGCVILETFSVSHGKASAYLPLIDLLKNYFEITSDDDERKRREKIGGKVLMLDRMLEDTLPYLFSLLGVAEGIDALGEMDAHIRRRRTLDAIKRLLLRESLNPPLIVVFEDLHWVDSETQAFLNLLVESIGTARVLLMVNYRPEYRHEWGAKSYYAQLRLDPLGRESAESLLDALLGADAELAPLKRLIIERTEGNPFFMEETMQVMFENGALVRNGKVSLAQPLSSINIPPSVKGILAARIDRLSTPHKDLLQTLSIIGKEFPLGLVRRVLDKNEDALAPMMSALQLGEFIYEQPAFPEVEYIFKHALTQEVAYDSVLIERRKLIHEKTANALEAMYAQQLEDHLSELAHHFSHSTNLEKAIAYLVRAAEQARGQCGYDEAIERLTKALELLLQLPEGPERDNREVKLRTFLSQTLAAARGFSAPELAEQISRLDELVGRVSDPQARYSGLFAQWNVAFSRGNLKRSEEVAAALLAMTPLDATDMRRPSAYQVLGTSQVWRGRPREARENLERAVELFDRDLDNFLHSSVAPVVPNRCHLTWALWICGYPDQARKRADEALQLAMRLNRPYSIAFALQYAVSVAHLCRSYESSKAQAESLRTVAREHGFPIWQACGTASMGRVLIEEGDWEQGEPLMREGLKQVRGAGGELIYYYLLTLYAEACVLHRKIEEAYRVLDESLEGLRRTDLGMLESENHRLRGALLLLDGKRASEAEELFRTALRVALAQGAKSWELRAANSFARLLLGQGRHDEARALIEPVFNFFTEGFTSGDLREAKALLHQSLPQRT
jgi:class 3 adenylate cyclase/tetratricopeptide (TPR) repeat protein/ribosomal protein L40E